MTATTTTDPLAPTYESTARAVRTRGWRLHYHELGTGPVVLFLHGSGPGATGWNNFHLNVEDLSHTHRVLLLDQPGWGESDPFESASGGYVRVLEEFLDALEIDRVSFVGNSLGAINAIEFAMEYPERVDRLVLMGGPDLSSPHIFAPDGATLGLQTVYNGYIERTPDAYRRLVDVMTFGDRFLDDALIAERLSSALAHEEHLDAFVARASEPREAPEWTTTRLAALEHETLLVHGRDDQVVPFESSLRLLAMLPNSRALLFNQCGHWAQVERAEEFNRALVDFLR